MARFRVIWNCVCGDDGGGSGYKMKLEEVPSTAEPFIIVANHNYDQKATPPHTRQGLQYSKESTRKTMA